MKGIVLTVVISVGSCWLVGLLLHGEFPGVLFF